MIPSTQPSSPSATASAPTSPAAPVGRRVTDAPTRVFHWLFALCFVGAYLTADGERWRQVHVVLGYTFAGLLGFRVLYGLLGPRQARLTALVRKLAAAAPWWCSVREAVRTPRPAALTAAARQGQNLAMAAVIAGLLLAVLPLTLSGVATFHDWGGKWLEEVHEFFGNTLLTLVLLHIGGLATLSLWRRQNLARPMLTGRTAGRGPDLITRNHGGLAALLLLAVLSYWAWEWQHAPALSVADHGQATAAWPAHGDDDEDDD